VKQATAIKSAISKHGAITVLIDERGECLVVPGHCEVMAVYDEQAQRADIVEDLQFCARVSAEPV